MNKPANSKKLVAVQDPTDASVYTVKIPDGTPRSPIEILDAAGLPDTMSLNRKATLTFPETNMAKIKIT